MLSAPLIQVDLCPPRIPSNVISSCLTDPLASYLAGKCRGKDLNLVFPVAENVYRYFKRILSNKYSRNNTFENIVELFRLILRQFHFFGDNNGDIQNV